MDVDAKYTIVRDTIFPFILAFKLAATVIRLDMSIGNVISFNIRRNNSPGYDINMMVSLDKLYERNVIPEKRLYVPFYCGYYTVGNKESIRREYCKSNGENNETFTIRKDVTSFSITSSVYNDYKVFIRSRETLLDGLINRDGLAIISHRNIFSCSDSESRNSNTRIG